MNDETTEANAGASAEQAAVSAADATPAESTEASKATEAADIAVDGNGADPVNEAGEDSSVPSDDVPPAADAAVVDDPAPAADNTHLHTILDGIVAKLHALDHIPFEAKAWLSKELARLKAHL